MIVLWERFAHWLANVPDRLDSDLAYGLARHPTISFEIGLGFFSILWGIWYGHPAWDVTRRPLWALTPFAGDWTELLFGGFVMSQGIVMVLASHRRWTGVGLLACLAGMVVYGFLAVNFFVLAPEAVAVAVYGWAVGAHLWCLLRVARIRYRNGNAP